MRSSRASSSFGRSSGGRNPNIGNSGGRCNDGYHGRGGRGNGRGRGVGGRSGSEGRGNGRGRGFGGRSQPEEFNLNVTDYSMSRFLVNIVSRCPSNRLKDMLYQYRSKWDECWTKLDELSLEGLTILLSCLARIPFSSDLQPPPLHACEQAMILYLDKVQEMRSFEGNDNQLEAVETAINVVQRILKFQWDMERGDVKNAIEQILARAEAMLSSRYPAHRKPIEKISLLFEELEKKWAIKTTRREKPQRRHNQNDDSLVSMRQQSWRQPTVEWLSSMSVFQPCKLPKMKIPDGYGEGVYESPQEYFDVVIRLWVGMTFVDGNNALLPHCTTKTQDKVCDHTLWPINESNGRQYCRTRDCSQRVTFACSNKNHETGLCRGCALRHQEALRGPPGRGASTHVYDGTVTRVRHDGDLFLEGVASRRPPERDIHWKTTRRLSCPNLVGIVRLANRGVSLRLSEKITWAQIRNHGDGYDEWKQRTDGKLALSIIDCGTATHGDISMNSYVCSDIKEGDMVAIIDCQTFVPEFVPILKALEIQRMQRLPFHDGALLNINRELGSIEMLEKQTVSMESSESESQSDDDPNDQEANILSDVIGIRTYLSLETIREDVEQVVQESMLEPIIQIRRNRSLRQELVVGLSDLIEETTLDEGQLESFLGSIRHPVHCTQGPPGTGKSYLGVVIVRAWLLIRRLWIEQMPSIGTPPILVLSYKNHAIDEFLVDLVKSGSFDNSSTYFRSKYTRGSAQLIRIGGGCNEPTLQRFKETTFLDDSSEIKALEIEIEDLYKLFDQIRQFGRKFSAILDARMLLLDPVHSDESKLAPQERRERSKIYTRAAITLERFVASVVGLVNQIEGPKDELSNEDDEHQQQITDEAEENEDELGKTAASLLKAGFVIDISDIKQLYDGIKHYDDSIHPTEILYQWMKGFQPLPCCAYEETECKDVILDDESLYCNDHRCLSERLIVVGVREDGEDITQISRCHQRILPRIQFCTTHCCEMDGCVVEKVSENQCFCSEHACFVCLEKNLKAGAATDYPPLNTCVEHPLCWARIESSWCTNAPVNGSQYCEIHVNRKCKGISRRGTPCKSVVSSGSYCAVHFYQETEEIEQEGEDESHDQVYAQCMAKTKKGKDCKGKPERGARYCSDHKHKAMEASAEKASKSKFNRLDRYQEEPESDAQGSKDSDVHDELKYSSDMSRGEESETFEDQNIEAPDSKSESNDLISLSDSNCPAGDQDGDSDSDAYFNVDYAMVGAEDEMEEPENLQHLMEVYEVQEDDERKHAAEDEVFQSFLLERDVELSNSDQLQSEYVAPGEWNWDMDLQTRWAAIDGLRTKWELVSEQILPIVIQSIEELKRRQHIEKVKLKARVFEGKSVIGGTIVGCVSRLEAIRSTNPFAILVEEASEVLEPLLFACLGSSTCKLEMIGDHKQLQPSVMTKFEFERINNMKISLFERLIRAPHGFGVPMSVLSLQRRMRRNICDLIRGFYTNITLIQDHPDCHTKRIKAKKLDKLRISKSDVLLQDCEGKGREVPGILPHLFFWMHEGVEERANVGLSKINTKEAVMVCDLAYYLVKCGVPYESIAILTTYKGQMKLIQNMLIKMKLYAPSDRYMDRFARASAPPSVTLSTVDRFQGDEADIVIVSLVIDGKSRTPFVKLMNRMIVLLSRARIGMYIIGNAEYFERSDAHIGGPLLTC